MDAAGVVSKTEVTGEGRKSDKMPTVRREQRWAPVIRTRSRSQNIVKVCYSQLDNREDSMESNQARFGFVSFAETWNGRLAMLGFVIGLGTELLTGQGILAQIGLG